MDGRYVLDALIAAMPIAPERTDLAQAARALVDGVSRRLHPLGRARVIWYEPNTLDVGWLRSRRHFSALTQATYARALARFGAREKDTSISRLAAACFEALIVPEPDGVLQESAGTVYLAEVPMRPRDLVLNAWLTTLEAVDDYGRITGDDRATALFGRCLAFLRRTLPLYDVPSLANSRYTLIGSVQGRIEIEPRISRPVIRDLSVMVPEEGQFPFSLGVGDRWAQEVDPRYASLVDGGFRPNHGVFQLNIVLSRIGLPRCPRLSFRLAAQSVDRLTIRLLLGQYDPTRSVPRDLQWKTVSQVQPSPDGSVEIPLDWQDLDLIGYPTNFGKRIGESLVNSFHYAHITRLRSLATRLNADDLRRWADRWEDAMQRWPDMECYQGLSVLIGDRVMPVESLHDPAWNTGV